MLSIYKRLLIACWCKKLILIATSDDPKAFDSEMIAYPHVFELDGKTYMMYLGNSVGRYGFGLAELEGEL
jgi:hypothetical protein